MNKFEMFLGRILAEACLKMDYFGNKLEILPEACPKSPSSGGFAPRSPFRLND